MQTTTEPVMSSLITQAWDEKAINTGTQHMLMNGGLHVGIVQPHNVLKSWQGWPFYLAKSASGQPLGTDIIPVVQACQRWIDMTCQHGHVKIAQSHGPKMLDAPERRSDFASLCFCRMLSGCGVPAVSHTSQGLLFSQQHGPSEARFRDGEGFVLTVFRG